MNYRMKLQADVDRLSDRFGVTKVLSYYESDREMAPTQSIAAICSKGNDRLLDEFRWGLMPFWAKDAVLADARSVLSNKIFDYLLKRQRCVIPCSAYYRVQQEEDAKKPEQRVVVHEGEALAMAGVYDVWASPQGEELRTCTILSVKAASSDYGENVPMLLEAEQLDAWLGTEFLDMEQIESLVASIASTQPKPLLKRVREAGSGPEGSGLEPYPPQPVM